MQLLTELDGVEALNGVFVFAATRYLMLLPFTYIMSFSFVPCIEYDVGMQLVHHCHTLIPSLWV